VAYRRARVLHAGGAVPTDGSGSLVEWGDGGTSPVVSPDGQRVTWLSLSSPICEKQELVVRTISSGEERRSIVGGGSAGFAGARGPWWEADNTILFSYADTGTAVLAYRSDTLARLPGEKTRVLGCLVGDNEVVGSRPMPDGTGVIISRSFGDGHPTSIERCRFDHPVSMLLATTPTWTFGATLNRDGERLLLIGIDGAISIATANGAVTALSAGPYLSAAW
jgi:hypothetical protein